MIGASLKDVGERAAKVLDVNCRSLFPLVRE